MVSSPRRFSLSTFSADPASRASIASRARISLTRYQRVRARYLCMYCNSSQSHRDDVSRPTIVHTSIHYIHHIHASIHIHAPPWLPSLPWQPGRQVLLDSQTLRLSDSRTVETCQSRGGGVAMDVLRRPFESHKHRS